MKARHLTSGRRWRGSISGSLLALLLLPLLATVSLAAAGPASAVVLCLPAQGESSCVSGTVGNRTDPVAAADVSLLDADGAEVGALTTEDDGKFSFQVTEPGDYFLVVDPDSLGDTLEIRPPAPRFQGPDGSILVPIKRLGTTVSPDLNVRAVDYEAGADPFSERIVQSIAQGLRLGLLLALASIGLSLIYGTTGLSNFAHAEQVTLGGMVGYGLCNVDRKSVV